MKILMIGGIRFIGAHVVRRLYDAGADVVVFHRGSSTNPILPEIQHVLDPGAKYQVTAFPDQLRRDSDVVIHTVAIGHADAEAATRTHAVPLAVFDGAARVGIADGPLMPRIAARAVARELAKSLISDHVDQPLLRFVAREAETIQPELLDMAPQWGTLTIDGVSTDAATARQGATVLRKALRSRPSDGWEATVTVGEGV